MEMIDLQLNAPAAPAPLEDNGPGSASSRVIDIGNDDPLVHLGLVDPRSGAALPTDDWQPATSPRTVATPAPSTQTVVAGGASTTVNTPPAPNPLAGQQLQLTMQTLQAQAAQAYAEAVAGGADPGTTKAIIDARLEAEGMRVRTSALQQALLPTAKSQVATLIASRLGAGQVRAEELLGYESPQAMEQAAQQLAASRRATNFQNRQSAGTDRVEGSAPSRGISPAIDGLSPEKKIELGIRRGQY